MAGKDESPRKWLDPPRTVRRVYASFRESVLGPWLERVEYGLYLFALRLSASIPSGWHRKAGALLGQLAVYLMHRTRTVCERNLKLAADRKDLPDDVYDKQAKKVFQYWGTALMEFGYLMPRIKPGRWQKYMTVHGEHHLEKAIARYGSAVVSAPHMGNWELIGQALALLDYPIYSVYRERSRDTPVERGLFDWRRINGQELISEEASPRTLIRLLRDGKLLGLVSDQYAKSGGVKADFFGARTTHHPGSAILSIRAGVPLIPAYCHRDRNRMHYHVHFTRPVDRPDMEKGKELRKEVTRRLFHRFEFFIRKYPEQWLWMHRKWRDKWLREERKQELTL